MKTKKYALHFVKILKGTMLLACMIFLLENASSQCVNTDFSLSNFTYWTGSTGTNISGIYSNVMPGIIQGATNSPPTDAGRHTILNVQATDPNTANLLNVLPPGGTTSCRLGNENVNYEAERLEYIVTVDTSNNLFIYQYAVVLEDPAHPIGDQPKFSIYVMDTAGVVVDTVWGIYEVSSQPGLPGWNDATHVADGETDHWKDWAAVAVDLSAHMGENITVQFTTYDCAQGAHFGYAYISCYCTTQMIRQHCDGITDSISVPDGFISYLWNTGETTQFILRTSSSFGDSISCRGITESRDTIVFKGKVTCIPTGIEEEINNIQGLYPNPATNTISVSLPDKATIEILNMQGQIIKTIANAEKETTIDLTNVSSGIYIIRVQNEKGIGVKKFVKE